jgi:hypothetical protein
MGPTKPAFLMAFFLTLLSSPISLAARRSAAVPVSHDSGDPGRAECCNRLSARPMRHLGI